MIPGLLTMPVFKLFSTSTGLRQPSLAHLRSKTINTSTKVFIRARKLSSNPSITHRNYLTQPLITCSGSTIWVRLYQLPPTLCLVSRNLMMVSSQLWSLCLSLLRVYALSVLLMTSGLGLLMKPLSKSKDASLASSADAQRNSWLSTPRMVPISPGGMSSKVAGKLCLGLWTFQ
jgi:hypothetical protein